MSSVCFKVHGDDYTRMVRDIFFEGGWQKALRLVLDSFDGISIDTIIEILSGRKALTGVNDLELVDEEPALRAEIEGKLADLVCGLVEFRGRWFRPYGYTAGPYTKDDLPIGRWQNHWIAYQGRTGAANDARERSTWGAYRNLHYARDSQEDMLTHSDYQGRTVAVFWEQVSDPPFWFAPHGYAATAPAATVHFVSWLDGSAATQFQSAFEAYVAAVSVGRACYLDLRGGKADPAVQAESLFPDLEYANTVVSAVDDAEEEAGELCDSPLSSDMRAVATMAIAQLQARGMDLADAVNSVCASLGLQDTESAPTAGEVADSQTGYLLPDGRYYPCGYHEHTALAQRLFKLQGIEPAMDVEQAADQLGWIRIHRSAVDNSIYIHEPRHLTDAQEMTLLEYRQHWGVTDDAT